MLPPGFLCTFSASTILAGHPEPAAQKPPKQHDAATTRLHEGDGAFLVLRNKFGMKAKRGFFVITIFF